MATWSEIAGMLQTLQSGVGNITESNDRNADRYHDEKMFEKAKHENRLNQAAKVGYELAGDFGEDMTDEFMDEKGYLTAIIGGGGGGGGS